MIKWFGKDRKGATAVEFAFVAMPFLVMLIGMVELAVYFTTASLLAEATNVGARMVRTGQFEGNSDAETAFRKAVCDRAAVFIECGNIQFQVTHINNDDFRSAGDYNATFDKDGNLKNQGYQDASASSVILVRLVYRYPFMTPLIGDMLSDGPNQTRLIMDTVVMKNEPYNA